METITLARRRSTHQQAAFIGERLYSEKIARIHRTTFDEQRAAFEYFKRYGDKEYSSVDCLSFVVMDSLGITEALAIDSDFTHRFTARPGPLRR
jgi:predicted nucleic acid-binding protein